MKGCPLCGDALSVRLTADQHAALEDLVERSEGSIPASVESLVGIAVDGFIEGATP